MSDVLIRPESREDRDAIHAVNLAAFGQSEEADLVDRLRETVHPFLSWVAESGGGR